MKQVNGYKPLAEWQEITSELKGFAGASAPGLVRTMEGWCELIRLKGASMSHAERLDCERALGVLHRRLTNGSRARAAA